MLLRVFIIIQNKKVKIYQRIMSNSKLKIEFHPQKISTSNSKQKYSPYRRKQKRTENDDILIENKQKLALNQPLIRFRRLIESNSTKNKLKLTHDAQNSPPYLTAATAINSQEYGLAPNETCTNCAHLLMKIQQQTAFLKQNLREINHNLKLPKITKDESENKTVQDHQQYAKNQKIIINYLQQIKNRGEETNQVKKEKIEQQVQILRKALAEWQARCKFLEEELDLARVILNDREHHLNMLQDKKSTNDAATSSQSISIEKESKGLNTDFAQPNHLFKYGDQMKLIMTDIIQRHSCDFQIIMKELQSIKLENDMLREEVKLLNYAMNEKDAKIDVLKNQLMAFIQKNRRPYIGSPHKSAKSSAKYSTKKSGKRVQMQSIDVSIECISNSQKKKELTINNKRSSSILFNSKNNFVLNKLKSDVYEADRRSDQGDFLLQNYKKGKTQPLNMNMSLQLAKRSCSVPEENTITIAKPLLKIKKQESMITKHEKQQMQRQKKQFLYFSQNKLRDLDLIRRTLEHRLKGFKFTFQELQRQMLNREHFCITYDEMDELLSGYPFSLDNRLRQIVLDYILLEETGENRKMAISNDIFCNRLRQLLADYEEVDEEQELLILQKLKKKVYMYLQGILTQCLEVEDRRGLVSECNLQSVLQQFKLSNFEIEMFINQCCLLSIDADHLDYKHYLSIFQNDQ